MKILRKLLKKLTAGVILASVAASSGWASPFYIENFSSCKVDESGLDTATDSTGWKAFRSNSTVGKVGFLKISSPGSPDSPSTINSFSSGKNDGAVFWSKPVKGLTIFTEEFLFDVGALFYVQYQQRLGGYSSSKKHKDGTQLLFLIDDTWYISDTITRQRDRGIWESVGLSPKELTYGTSKNITGIGPRAPRDRGARLPTQGLVRAFGVFIPSVTDRVRIDNFVLGDASLDVRIPSAHNDEVLCGGIPETGLIAPTPTPVPTSSTNDATDLFGNIPGVKGVFCSGKSLKAAGKINATGKVKKLILKTTSGRSVQARRDRAILELLFSSSLRIDQLVNTAVGDYVTVGNIHLLKLSGKSKQAIVLNRNAQKYLAAYLGSTGLANRKALPLFQGIDTKANKVNLSALCASDYAKIVSAKLKFLKLRNALKIER